MAELIITAGEVKPGSGAKILHKPIGELIDAGKAVADVSGTLWLFEADHTTTTKAVFAGIAINKGYLAGQYVGYVHEGAVIIGTSAAPTLGKVYLGGRTAGSMAPAGDTTNTGRVNVVGVCTETTSGTITVNKYDSGVNGTI